MTASAIAWRRCLSFFVTVSRAKSRRCQQRGQDGEVASVSAQCWVAGIGVGGRLGDEGAHEVRSADEAFATVNRDRDCFGPL